MGWLSLLLALLAPPAEAQRPRCGYGEALAGMQAAEERLAALPGGLLEARGKAEAVASGLRGSAGGMAGCGCPRLAEGLGEAAGIAEPAIAAASLAEALARLERARFALRLVREAEGRQGCR
jgi:hypothetical protein